MDFENEFYGSRICIEKLDSETGENILHDGALFKTYAAKRDVSGTGTSSVKGTGDVLFDKNGMPLYDESEQIIMRDETGAEVGIFKAYSTVRDGEAEQEDGSLKNEKILGQRPAEPSGKERITVYSDAFLENTEEKLIPAQEIVRDGCIYELQGYTKEKTVIPAHEELAEDTVLYEAVEATDTIPEHVPITVTDERTGQNKGFLSPGIRFQTAGGRTDLNSGQCSMNTEHRGIIWET